MKNKAQIVTIFLVILYWMNLNSQSLLVDGVEWYYTQSEFWTPGFNINYCYIQGDTIIQQKSCKKYYRTTMTCDARPIQEFLYEENDKLYYYESSKDTFQMLFDYSANVGDTVKVEYWDSFWPQDSIFYIRVDSIKEIDYNSIILKKFYVTYDRLEDETIDFEFGYKGEYLEGLGGVLNFFHFVENGGCDWKYNTRLRCFNHPDYGLIKFVDIECDSVYTVSTDELDQSTEIKVFPNPINELLSIQSKKTIKNASIVIYNLMGKKVYEEKVSLTANDPIEIKMEALNGTIYLVLIKDKEGKLKYSNKILKK